MSGPKYVQDYEKVDRDLFLDTIKPRAKPAILRGLVKDWPAVAAGRESAAALKAYIAQFYSGLPAPYFEGPPDIKGRFFYNERMDGFNFEPKHGPLNELMDHLCAITDAESPAGLYAGSLAIPAFLPGFAAQNSIAAMIPSTSIMNSIWIGNRTLIAPHYDNTENIACVIGGQRRFTLFPIEHYKNMYAGPPDLTPAGQTISLVDIRQPDLVRFPRFKEALDAAEVAELEPGDAIYIPTLWWHGVESLSSFGVLVNSWWRDVPDYFDSPANSLLHCLLSLKDLPPVQRQRWKAVFDYLIFQSDEPALSHLPPEAMNLYGDLTPAKAARLRNYLAKTLNR